jgi:CDP-Glycerol:Poly(glycerophosphate) glycerophosphotransferase
VTIAYYAANIQGLTWVKPIHDLTGGVLCTDREATSEQARREFPGAEVRYFDPGSKWSVRLARGDRRGLAARRADHIPLARIARELQPDVIVTTANFPHYIRRRGWGALRQGGAYPNVKQAQIFHGISSKNNKFRRFMANYDLLLFVGERDKQRFDRIGVTAKARWKLIGLPRSDRIARGEIERTAVLRELGLDTAKPTVLYAPTHGSLSSFFPWGPEICRAVGPNCNLIVKPHPLIARAVQSADAEDAAWTAVQAYVAERSNAVFLPGQADIQQLMVAADVLVTDFSSAAEEFLMLNRPLVFANHLAGSGYHLTRGEWDEIHSCGAVVMETRNLQGAIARALEHPEEFEPQRTRMRDHVFYQVDGHAAERAANALRELCNG